MKKARSGDFGTVMLVVLMRVGSLALGLVIFILSIFLGKWKK